MLCCARSIVPRADRKSRGSRSARPIIAHVYPGIGFLNFPNVASWFYYSVWSDLIGLRMLGSKPLISTIKSACYLRAGWVWRIIGSSAHRLIGSPWRRQQHPPVSSSLQFDTRSRAVHRAWINWRSDPGFRIGWPDAIIPDPRYARCGRQRFGV